MQTSEMRNPGALAGASGIAARQVSEANDTALRRVKGLLPCIALEARIALDVARDVYVTGGCDVEDGKRLATAYERLKRIAEVVAEAERAEVKSPIRQDCRIANVEIVAEAERAEVSQ